MHSKSTIYNQGDIEILIQECGHKYHLVIGILAQLAFQLQSEHLLVAAN